MEDTESKAFKQFDIVTDYSDHHFTSENSFDDASEDKKKKIMEEWNILQENLPEAIFIRVYETRIDLLRAVIVGASGTPYHDGLFFFDIAFPSNYPNNPPKVHFDSHRFRLNPNLYVCGYVCMSLLNTWKDKVQYHWNPSESTILQVLVSLQRLVLNSKPYFNEPGNGSFAESKANCKWQSYNRSIFNLSCKIMANQLKAPPKNFEEFVALHFRKRGDAILKACKDYIEGRAIVGYLTDGKSSKIKVPESFKKGLIKNYETLVMAFDKNREKANEDDEKTKDKRNGSKIRKADVAETKLPFTKLSKRPKIDSRSKPITEHKFF